MEEAIKSVAAAWKKLLANSDAALGIDAEFTRPGVMALLEKVAKTMRGATMATAPTPSIGRPSERETQPAATVFCEVAQCDCNQTHSNKQKFSCWQQRMAL